MFTQSNGNRQNSYTLARPVTLDEVLTGYAKILLFIDASSEARFNRLDLIKDALNQDYTYDRNFNRGTMINIFATMRYNDILEYNTSDRKWSRGSNFEQYMSSKLQTFRV